MPPKCAVKPDDILRVHSPDVVACANLFRALAREAVPELEERALPGWHAIGLRAPGVGHFAAVFPYAETCRLYFEHGARLPDQDRVLRGETKQTRHVEARRVAEVPREAVFRLLFLATRA